MPVPRPPQVNVPSRRTGPLPPLDPESLPSSQGASARQQWRRVRNQIRSVCTYHEEACQLWLHGRTRAAHVHTPLQGSLMLNVSAHDLMPGDSHASAFICDGKPAMQTCIVKQNSAPAFHTFVKCYFVAQRMLMDAGVTSCPLHLTGIGLLMKILPSATIQNIGSSGIYRSIECIDQLSASCAVAVNRLQWPVPQTI